MINELLPIASGLVVGALLGLVRPSLRLPVGAALAVLLGTLATIASGEYRIGWEFLLIDIPLVGLCAVAGLVTARRVREEVRARQEVRARR
ncbi:MAG TPA: hypothetical protein VLB86_00460 [Gaiellaceae bacterium]|nr:hypothetical protein [Gaiellaceae bacterium]